jgi:hypothetical protein
MAALDAERLAAKDLISSSFEERGSPSDSEIPDPKSILNGFRTCFHCPGCRQEHADETALPKVLHEVGGRPMIDYVLDAAREAGARQVVIVG